MSEQERKPPEKIRVTKLQEAQLAALTDIELACAEQLWELGLSAELVEPRGEVAIAALPRHHDVLVAEADHEPAAYLAWADEAPGVAWMPIFMVAPAYQRFGVGTHLLRALGEAAGKHGIATVVTPSWDQSPSAMSFLSVRGFQMLGASMPEQLEQWVERRAQDAATQGQTLWWAMTDGLGTVPGLPRPPR